MAKKELTKQMLEEMEVEVIGIDVYHTTKTKGKFKLNPCLNTQYHPYGAKKRQSYYMIGWYDSKTKTGHMYPYHRVLYAWYNGVAHAGMDIDHIDGNSLNNDINNLREVTRKENLSKRQGAHNQYANGGGRLIRKIDKMLPLKQYWIDELKWEDKEVK